MLCGLFLQFTDGRNQCFCIKDVFLNQDAYNEDYWLGPYFFDAANQLAYVVGWDGGGGGSPVFDNLLYAANFHTGHVDVFDTHFASKTLMGSFTDPNLPDMMRASAR